LDFQPQLLAQMAKPETRSGVELMVMSLESPPVESSQSASELVTRLATAL